MGGKGSGSKPGRRANNYKDGRRIYRQNKTARKCESCGKRVSGFDMTRDHRKPAQRDRHGNVKGGDNSASNQSVLCRSCHARRENRRRRNVRR